MRGTLVASDRLKVGHNKRFTSLWLNWSLCWNTMGTFSSCGQRDFTLDTRLHPEDSGLLPLQRGRDDVPVSLRALTLLISTPPPPPRPELEVSLAVRVCHMMEVFCGSSCLAAGAEEAATAQQMQVWG